ncbi:flavin reductase family protein [Gordonia sp. VNK21]|uniref:flavin reductase family protein n=1 Tax=Gordonia sp. VNK21 TaxID=3382483 RepID=UPI0038D467E0
MSTPALADRAAPAPRLDQAGLRRAYGQAPSPLVAIAALGPDGPIGLIASSFTSVSIEPALVSVNIALSSTTLPLLREAPHWGVSVLADGQQEVTEQLRRPARRRFDQVAWSVDEDGAVHLDGAAAGFSTQPAAWLPAGDHTIVLLQVHDHYGHDHRSPLVFHRSTVARLSGGTLR